MRVVTRQEVVEFIRERGGRLYVWADLMRCPGPKCTFFTTSIEPPEEPHDFRRFGGGGFDLFFSDEGLEFFSDEGLEPPPELRLQLTGRRERRVSAYEGYSWVMDDEIPE